MSFLKLISDKKFWSFFGTGLIVSVAYMDPGNWGTSISSGASFNYDLLWVIWMASGMAMLFQYLSGKLGIAGYSLPELVRRRFKRKGIVLLYWLLAEFAILATDLAEFLGIEVALNLLFGIPLELGVVITALDVFLILYLQNLGFRWIEAFVVSTLLVIAASFAVQVGMADPEWRQIIIGFAPTVEIVRNPEMLYLAMGILGATVMPHNLYLHSSIVQTRMYGDSFEGKKEAIRYATIDSTVALMSALFWVRIVRISSLVGSRRRSHAGWPWIVARPSRTSRTRFGRVRSRRLTQALTGSGARRFRRFGRGFGRAGRVGRGFAAPLKGTASRRSDRWCDQLLHGGQTGGEIEGGQHIGRLVHQIAGEEKDDPDQGAELYENVEGEGRDRFFQGLGVDRLQPHGPAAVQGGQACSQADEQRGRQDQDARQDNSPPLCCEPLPHLSAP